MWSSALLQTSEYRIHLSGRSGAENYTMQRKPRQENSRAKQSMGREGREGRGGSGRGGMIRLADQIQLGCSGAQ